jgi:hypothetical protein
MGEKNLTNIKRKDRNIKVEFIEIFISRAPVFNCVPISIENKGRFLWILGNLIR